MKTFHFRRSSTPNLFPAAEGTTFAHDARRKITKQESERPSPQPKSRYRHSIGQLALQLPDRVITGLHLSRVTSATFRRSGSFGSWGSPLRSCQGRCSVPRPRVTSCRVEWRRFTARRTTFCRDECAPVASPAICGMPLHRPGRPPAPRWRSWPPSGDAIGRQRLTITGGHPGQNRPINPGGPGRHRRRREGRQTEYRCRGETGMCLRHGTKDRNKESLAMIHVHITG